MVQFFQQPLFIFTAASFLIAAISLWLIIDQRSKWIKLFGQKPIPDGELLKDLIGRIAKSERQIGGALPRIDVLEEIAKVSVQKVGFIRFNPFADTGGDQSFSLALLDREDNGVVISSLYTREGTRIYAKAIRGGQTKQSLSDEEKKVLNEAMR